MFYLFVRFLCGINGRFFFKEVEVNGLENIPTDGGFLLALNHSNSFLDGVICAFTNPIGLHYLTRSDVFAPPWEGILTSLHQVPVYRLRDGISKLAKNDETFAKCYRLSRNGIVTSILDDHLLCGFLFYGILDICFDSRIVGPLATR